MKLLQKKKFKPEIKPMIKNLQDELLNYKKDKKKMLNFVLTAVGSWRLKNARKPFSNNLKDRICKIKEYLNYIMMITNQNILDS